MKKRLFALVLALCMVVSMMPAVAAAGYDDTNDHWAEDAIARWSEHGIVEGNDGLFSPNGELTRGQLAAIIARLLKLPEAPGAGFGDTDGHWAEDVINRCFAAGIMKGDGVNANPDKPISREETMVLLGRALGIKPVENADLSHYDDDHAVSDWAEGYVAAMTSAGIVNGVDGNLAPAAEIDRASTMTILNRAITTYVTEPGAVVESTGGIVLVAAEDVTVTGEAEAVVVTQGAAGGTTTLDNAKVGTVTVQAEASSVVVGENSAAVEVEVTETAAGAAVEVTKDAAVGTVTTAAAESTVTVSGTVQNVATTEQATGSAVEVTKTATVENVTTGAAASTVTVSGTVSNVTTTEQAAGATVEVTKDAVVENVTAGAAESTVTVSGTVSNVTVSDTAAGTTVEASKGAAIENVTTEAENTTVTGNGKVENVTTSGNNTSVETGGTKVEASEGTTGTTAGDKVVEGGESTTTKPTTPSTPSVSEHYCSYTAVVTAPTCTEKGYTTYTCRCGDSYVADYVDALGHDFETAAWSSDETGHWHVCANGCGTTDTKAAHVWLSNNCAEATECGTCGHDKAAGEHTWNAGVVTTPATCTVEGVKTFTCTSNGCGATETESVATVDHVFTTYTGNNDATCTEDGTETAECDYDCGEEDTRTVEGSAKSHSWSDGVVTKEPTCTEKGVKTFTCNNGCNETKTEDVPAKTHAWGDWTPNNNGTHTHVCGTDGSHTETEACDDNGTDGACSVCGDTTVYVAEVGGLKYETLTAALAAGSNIKLIKNITTDALFTVANGMDITLDLNGCTISAAEGRYYIISVAEGGTLTVNATNGGGITNGNVYGYAIVNYGTLTVNGGTFVGEYALYNGAYSSATATATLNGGTFIAREGTYYSIANCSNMTVAGATINDWIATSAQFTMTSGSIENLYANAPDKTVAAGTNTKITGGSVTNLEVDENNPVAVTGGTFSVDPSAYVAPGYEATEKEDGTWTVDVQVINSTEELAAAIAAGATDLKLAAGNYTMPISSNLQDKTLTITGTKDTVIDVSVVDARNQFVTGATLKFEGVTLNFGTADYMGFANTASLVYENCAINGYQYLYGPSVTFEDCIFNPTGYSVCTYGGEKVTFKDCTFNTAGKAVLIYKDDPMDVTPAVSVTGCTFNASAAGYAGAISNQPCAAIEIHNYATGVTLTTSGNTVDTDFSGEWRIKQYDNGGTITINGTVYTQTALDGKLMTVTDKNATVSE